MVQQTCLELWGKEIMKEQFLNFRDDFQPALTPYQMEYLGVFNGTYFKGDFSDFSESVKTSPNNYFGVEASQPMEV